MKTVHIHNLEGIKACVRVASSSTYRMEAIDNNGHIADCSSILGMLSLDYKQPIDLQCDSEREIDKMVEALTAIGQN